MKLTLHLKAQKTTRLLCPLILTLFFSFSVMAQQAVTGKITDADGNPLAGVSVTIRNKPGSGTSTNEQGSFTINANKGEVLVISRVGYETGEIVIGSQDLNDMKLTLKPGVLSEVVLIAYGSTTRMGAVSPVSVISGNSFGDNSAILPAELLHGGAAGVQVVRRAGTPGINVHVMIRGSGSFTSLEPLYIVDGIRSDGIIFNSIHPQDIENITILKDAASAALYGANGANGVVIITTKKGKKGPPVLSFSTQWGINMPPKKYKLLNAAQYLDLAKEYVAAYNQLHPLDPIAIPQGFSSKDGADWQDEVFRNGLLSNTHVGISGGNERMIYNIGLGYLDQKSVLSDYRYRAANLRVSLQETFGKVRLGQNINFQYQHQTGDNEYALPVGTIRNALQMPPYLNVFDAAGDFTAPNANDLLDEDNAIYNPIARLRTKTHTARYYIFNPQVYAELQLLKSLKFRSQLSLKLNAHNFSDFQKGYNTGFEAEESETGEEQFNSIGYLLENYATWNQNFNGHHFTITAGNSYIDKGRSSILVVEAEELSANSVPNISIAFHPIVHEALVSYANPAEISYFGRLVYEFDNKYIFSASIRRDGSSIFGSGNKFGNFPAFGAAWNLQNEKFFQKIKGISNLKLRVNWGKTGNSNGDAFQVSQGLFNGIHAGTLISSLGDDEEFAPGITVSRFPNPLLKWEETVETDAGIDIALFDSKLRISADWYKRTNKDLLVDVPIPNSTGATPAGGGGSILSNAASVQNQGFELQLGWSKMVNKDFSYNLSLNGAYNKNKVISIGTEFVGEITGGYVRDDLPITMTRPGIPIGSFYGLQIDHLDKATGDFVFKDLSKDGVIDDDDKTILGCPIPKFLFGTTIGVGYKNFDFSMLLSGAAGLKLYNDMKTTLLGTRSLHNVSVELLDRWKKPGDNAKYPGAFHGEENYQPSDFFIEDGSYLRAKVITIGYTLPQSALNRMKNVIKNLRFYISSENLFTITGYSGYDPEVSRIAGDIIFSRGLDLGQSPQTRTFLAGVHMNF